MGPPSPSPGRSRRACPRVPRISELVGHPARRAAHHLSRPVRNQRAGHHRRHRSNDRRCDRSRERRVVCGGHPTRSTIAASCRPPVRSSWCSRSPVKPARNLLAGTLTVPQERGRGVTAGTLRDRSGCGSGSNVRWSRRTRVRPALQQTHRRSIYRAGLSDGHVSCRSRRSGLLDVRTSVAPQEVAARGQPDRPRHRRSEPHRPGAEHQRRPRLAPDGGLPRIGQAVKKGDLLALRRADGAAGRSHHDRRKARRDRATDRDGGSEAAPHPLLVESKSRRRARSSTPRSNSTACAGAAGGARDPRRA